MSSALKEQFLAIVRNDIHREGIDKLVKYLEESDFFEAPASTRYHGSYEGGLVQHCIDVYNALHDELAFIYGDNYLAMYSEESIAIVSLFHDLCKIGRYVPGTKREKDPVTQQWYDKPAFFYNKEAFEMGHGAASVYTIQKFIQLEDFEAQAIFWHMGAYDISNYMNLDGLGSAYEKNTLSFALHRADMMATYIIDNPNFVEAPEYEQIEEADDAEPSSDEAVSDDVDEDASQDGQDDEAESADDNYSDEPVEFNPADYDDWDIDDIKDEIREWGEEPKKRAKRSELLKQLERLMTGGDAPF